MARFSLAPLGESVGKICGFAAGVLLVLLLTPAVHAQTPQSVFTSQTPATLEVSDGVPYELGMKFRSAKSGQITAIRFWKTANDTGGNAGTIWSAAGVPLATVTFSGMTSSGWQQQALATPLAIQANTTYVVSARTSSYFAMTGSGLASAIVNADLSSVADGANGVFGNPGAMPASSWFNGNYFRDIVFVADLVPSISKVSGDNQIGYAGTALLNSLVVQVKDRNGNPQPGSAVTFTVTGGGGAVSPASAVTDSSGFASTSFTLGGSLGTNTVRADAPGVGNVDFTATASAQPPLSGQTVHTTQVPVWDKAPTNGASYELGMKFRAQRAGNLLGIRFYKSPGEAGTHTGSIWSASGTLLTSVTFVGETTSGWQQQNLPSPLHVLADTTYVVSVNAVSFYPFSAGGLGNSIVNGDLSSVADGNNGVYAAPGIFPNSSYQSANYFRDVVYKPDPVPSVVKASGNNQAGLLGSTLPNALVVLVRDANNNPQAGVTVTFAVTAGTGSVSPASAVTNANGNASTTLTLGTSGGTTIVTATAVSIGSVAFTEIAGNAIYFENQKPGTPDFLVNYQIRYSIDVIAGYADATSVNRGGSLNFKVSTSQPGPYSIDVYRLGYYGGIGGRLVTRSGSLNGITQAPCAVTDAATHLVECKWTTGYTLNVAADWTSGIYMAKLVHAATLKESAVYFTVRDDSSTSQIVFQSSLTTRLAYGYYGTPTENRSLYVYNSTNGVPAQKVSLDRPSTEQADYNSLLNFEYQMLRWLESQSYDITYIDNLDVHLNPGSLLNHKVFLSVGHDEYWSQEMRNGVEAARDRGVNLGFFSANTSYWRVRFEPSSTGVANRVMACYKDPVATPDPVAPTYRWRDAPNNRPENAMIGVMYIGDAGDLFGGFDYVVANSSDPYYANTGVVNGTIFSKLVGYEWDAVVNNGFSPQGLVILGSSTVTPTAIAAGQPQTATQISNAARYTATSGAKVFATGSIHWVWALDSAFITPARVDARAQQFTVNVLSSMGAKPLTPNPGIVVP